MSLAISVVSDVVCPWCYVGKRRLERALDTLGLRETSSVSWLPFELNPDMPEGGMERSAYRAAKFGPDRAAALDERMSGIGREEGIAFAFDRMTRTPNTRAAHSLIAAAGSAEGEEGQDRLVDALFRAYFEDARDVGDPAVLVDVAASVGFERDWVDEMLRAPELRQRVFELEDGARRMGVSGVPFFIVDRRWSVSGAQPSSDWIELLRSHVGQAPAAAVG